MAITYPPTYEAVQTFSSATSWTITKPTLADGDWVFLVCVTDSDHSVLTPPDGFTHHGPFTDDTTDSSLSMFSKYIPSAATEAGVTWTVAWQFASEVGSCLPIIVQGGHPTRATALDPSPQGTGATFGQTNPATATHTPAADDCVLIAAFGSDPAAAVTGTPGGTGGTWVERVENTNGTVAFIYAQDLLQTTAAAAVGQPTGFTTDRYNRIIWSVAPDTGGGGGGLAVYIRDALMLDE